MTNITITIDDGNDSELDTAFAALFPSISGTGREVLEYKLNQYIVDCWNVYRKQQNDLGLVLASDLTTSGG